MFGKNKKNFENRKKFFYEIFQNVIFRFWPKNACAPTFRPILTIFPEGIHTLQENIQKLGGYSFLFVGNYVKQVFLAVKW